MAQRKKESLSEDIVVFHWSYEPQNFFKDSVTIVCDKRYKIEICNRGNVEARVNPEHCNLRDNSSSWSMRNELKNVLDIRFRVEGFFTDKTYCLSDGGEGKADAYRYYANGSKPYVFSFMQSIPMYFGNPVKPKKNTLSIYELFMSCESYIFDSLTEEEKTFVGLVQKNREDILLKRMFDSYSDAINFAELELVRLYDIRELIKSALNVVKEDEVRKQLGIDNKTWKTTWKELGNLACVEKFKESRHSGKFKELKPIGKEDQRKARSIARYLIERYLLHLMKR